MELIEPLLSLTLSPTIIAASERRNVIPAICDVTVDCRILPGKTPEDVEPIIRGVLNRTGVDEGDYELEFLERWGGTRSAMETPLWRAIEGWVDATEPGAKSAPVCCAGFTDSHWLRDAFGTVAYGFFPMRTMDPELAARLIHSADERVHVDDLELGVEFLRELARSPLAGATCSSSGRRTEPSSGSRRTCASAASSPQEARSSSRTSTSATASRSRCGARPPRRRRSRAALPLAAVSVRDTSCRVCPWDMSGSAGDRSALAAELDGRRVRRRRRGGARLRSSAATSTRSTSSSTSPRTSRASRPRSWPRSRRFRPLAPYLAGDGWAIASASPELFLARRGRRVWTMPIKGTRPLGEHVEGAKDEAEHVMIVDLERNDLSRVCEPGSVRWPELMAERELAGVTHLVSRVEGTLREDVSLAELLAATFPGGSVTGAPKLAALDEIARLEPVGRGASMGALGTVRGNGDLELALTIRTFAIAEGRIHLWVGGGIVWDSDPHEEIEESWTKARPLLAAIGAPLEVERNDAARRRGRRPRRSSIRTSRCSAPTTRRCCGVAPPSRRCASTAGALTASPSISGGSRSRRSGSACRR